MSKPSSPAGSVIGNRYLLLEPLGRGSMGAVYKARDRMTGAIVALKCVELSPTGPGYSATDTLPELATATETINAGGPSSALSKGSHTEALELCRLALAHEFQVLSSLRHPYIISVLDYGFWEGQPYFTMELLPACKTLYAAGAHLGTADKVRLLAQVLLALCYMHRRAVLHRDLKPSNVLCVGQQLKVVDFGVAAAIGYVKSVAGTLEYMAPEVLVGNTPLPASDIYSFGVMACELLTGVYPFDLSSATRYLSDVLAKEHWSLVGSRVALIEALCARLSPTTQGQIAASPSDARAALLDRIEPLKLREFVRQAMAPSLKDRFATAEAALEALEEAAGESFGAEVASTRESFLQAARLIGRDRELYQLEQALDAARKGRGGVWLIAGESGIGKSRLLNELRALALVRGAQVVRGQAITGGGAAHKEWGEVMRSLCITTEIGSLEARVLKSLVPDLPELLGRSIQDPPELDSNATMQRLFDTVLGLLLRQSVPTVIILEDLHWSSPESLMLLRRLTRDTSSTALLVLASYRNDERADLPQQLPGSHYMQLERLSSTQVAELAHSMLGSLGRDDQVLAILEKESEGNTFFLIEVVRALAEQSGGLEAIGREKLPQAVQTGGMQAILSRRLERVPQRFQELLQQAAVVGRQIDLAVMRQLDADSDAFLQACTNAAVLEVFEQQWRFSHDKLREAVLSSLSPAKRRLHHGQVARAMEQAYEGNRAPHAVRLAFHFQEAELPERAAHYSVIAAELARQAGALREATAHLDRALAYYNSVGAPALVRGRLYRVLAEIWLGLGEFDEVEKNAQQAMAMFGMPMPKGGPGWLGALAVQVAHFLAAMAWPLPGKPLAPDKLALLHEAQKLMWSYGLALANNDKQEQAGLLSLISLHIAQQTQGADALIESLSAIAVMSQMIGLSRLQKRCQQRARDLLPGCSLRSHQYFLISEIVFLQGSGKLSEILAATEQMRRISRELGDTYSLTFALISEVRGFFDRGDLDRSAAINTELRHAARQTESPMHRAWVNSFDSLLAYYRDELPRAMELAQKAQEFAEQSNDLQNRVAALAIQALVKLRWGQFDEAVGLAERLLQLTGKGIVAKIVMVSFVAAPAEIFMSVWRHDSSKDAPARAALLKKAQHSVAQLKRGGEMFRLRFLLESGLLAELQGHPQRALAQLQACRAESRARGQLLEEGFACYELGRMLGVKDPAGRSHLEQALVIFRSSGAHWHRQRAEALLS